MENKIIQEAAAYVSALFSEVPGSHDVSHTLRVYQNALAIAAAESSCDLELVSLAALLHDADDHKLFKTEDNANARRFLSGQDLPSARIDEICRTINAVSFSRNRGQKPPTLEAMIVQDADRLDAIGAIGIARAFAYGGERGRPIADSVRHFHEKLLLLYSEMNTPAGRRMAARRHAFMLSFLEEMAAETN